MLTRDKGIPSATAARNRKQSAASKVEQCDSDDSDDLKPNMNNNSQTSAVDDCDSFSEKKKEKATDLDPTLARKYHPNDNIDVIQDLSDFHRKVDLKRESLRQCRPATASGDFNATGASPRKLFSGNRTKSRPRSPMRSLSGRSLTAKVISENETAVPISRTWKSVAEKVFKEQDRKMRRLRAANVSTFAPTVAVDPSQVGTPMFITTTQSTEGLLDIALAADRSIQYVFPTLSDEGLKHAMNEKIPSVFNEHPLDWERRKREKERRRKLDSSPEGRRRSSASPSARGEKHISSTILPSDEIEARLAILASGDSDESPATQHLTPAITLTSERSRTNSVSHLGFDSGPGPGSDRRFRKSPLRKLPMSSKNSTQSNFASPEKVAISFAGVDLAVAEWKTIRDNSNYSQSTSEVRTKFQNCVAAEISKARIIATLSTHGDRSRCGSRESDSPRSRIISRRTSVRSANMESYWEDEEHEFDNISAAAAATANCHSRAGIDAGIRMGNTDTADPSAVMVNGIDMPRVEEPYIRGVTKLDDTLYFGEVAKFRFYGKFRQLTSAARASKQLPKQKRPLTAAVSGRDYRLGGQGTPSMRPHSTPLVGAGSGTPTAHSPGINHFYTDKLKGGRRVSVRHSPRSHPQPVEVTRGNNSLPQLLVPNDTVDDLSPEQMTPRTRGLTAESYELKPEQMSPRTRFLARYLQTSELPPQPIILRMDRDSQEINLSRMVLKDDYILLLAEVLADLPRVSVVNVRGNKLTDISMRPLIDVVASQDRITELDLSENKCDSLTARALFDLVTRPDCPLKVLKLSGADLDDAEVAMFMSAFEGNSTITDLDLSNNLLGARGERIVEDGKWESQQTLLSVNSADLVGGAAVAAALCINKTITRLNLGWNKLGQLSAAHIAQSISVTRFLKELYLPYNGVGDLGAEMIGGALMDNKSIVILDLSYNGIGSAGSYVLATALLENNVLTCLDLSGNPVGDPGGAALVQTFNYHSCCDREILLNATTYPVRERTAVKDLRFLTGSFSLNLAKTSDRCTAMELLRRASLRRGNVFRRLEHVVFDRNGTKKTVIKLVRPENPTDHMGHAYGPWCMATHRTRHPYTLMQADEWQKIAAKLSLVDASTGKIWKVPLVGTLNIDFLCVPRCPTPIEALNATGLQRLIRLLTRCKDCIADLLRICSDLVLESEQLDEILSAMEDVLNPHELQDVLLRLLVCLRDTSNTDALIVQHVRDPILHRDIRLKLRSMFFICVGAYSGHYRLDLSVSYDCTAALRLAEINAEERAMLRRAMPRWAHQRDHGYTSQSGNRSCGFRNVSFNGIKITEGIGDDFFSRAFVDKNFNGELEFDFISISRVAEGATALADHDLNALLMTRDLRSRARGIMIAVGAADFPVANSGETVAIQPDSISSADKSTKVPSLKVVTKSAAKEHSAPSAVTMKSAAPGPPNDEGFDLLEEEDEDDDDLDEKIYRGEDVPDFIDEPETEAPHTVKRTFMDVIKSAAKKRGIDHISRSLVNKFRALRHHEGFWLTSSKHDTVAAMEDDLVRLDPRLVQGMRDNDLCAIHKEVMDSEAMYFAHDVIHRFVVRLSIRLRSAEGEVEYLSQPTSTRDSNEKRPQSAVDENRKIGEKSPFNKGSGSNKLRLPSTLKDIKTKLTNRKGNFDTVPNTPTATVASKMSEAFTVTNDAAVTQRRRRGSQGSQGSTEGRRSSGQMQKEVKKVQTRRGSDDASKDAVGGPVLDELLAFRRRGSDPTAQPTGSRPSSAKGNVTGKSNAGAPDMISQAVVALNSVDDVDAASVPTADRKLTLQIPVDNSAVSQGRGGGANAITPIGKSAKMRQSPSRKHSPHIKSKNAIEGPSQATNDSAEDENVLGSVLEVCCVYVREHDALPNGTKRIRYRYAGHHPTNALRTGVTPDQQPFSRLKDNAVHQHGNKGVAPTHERFILTKDAVLQGTDLIIKLGIEYWDNKEKTISYAKRVVERLFAGYGVMRSQVKFLHSYLADVEQDVFFDSHIHRSVKTHCVMHRMDVIAEELPYFQNAVLKLSMPLSSLAGGHLVRSELNCGTSVSQSTASSSFCISGGTEDTLLMATPTRINAELSAGSLIVSRRQNKRPEILQAATGVDDERVFCVWRWRHYTDSDRLRREMTNSEVVRRGTADVWLRRLTDLRCLTSRLWLRATQAARLVLDFPVMPVSSASDPTTFRECAIVTVFSRIIDLENFNIVADTMPVDNQAHLFNKIGWLNALNVFKINRHFHLDLSIDDNWRVAQMIVQLTLCRGGARLQGERFKRDHKSAFIAGWEIPAPWLPETYKGNLPKGIPHEGVFITNIIFASEPPANWRKVRRLLMRKYTLLGVPRSDGRDPHTLTLTPTVAQSGKPIDPDWDDLIP